MQSENTTTNIHRAKTLNGIKDWCFGRASHLSLEGQHQAAQALTNEHMEALEEDQAGKNALVEALTDRALLIATTQCVISQLQKGQISQQRTKQYNPAYVL